MHKTKIKKALRAKAITIIRSHFLFHFSRRSVALFLCSASMGHIITESNSRLKVISQLWIFCVTI